MLGELCCAWAAGMARWQQQPASGLSRLHPDTGSRCLLPPAPQLWDLLTAGVATCRLHLCWLGVGLGRVASREISFLPANKSTRTEESPQGNRACRENVISYIFDC